jgi:type II secretory pathway pseudopilin PulG
MLVVVGVVSTVGIALSNQASSTATTAIDLAPQQRARYLALAGINYARAQDGAPLSSWVGPGGTCCMKSPCTKRSS